MILFDWICLFVILFLIKIIREMYLNGGTNDTTNETIEKLFKKNINETTTTTTQLNTTLLLLSVCGRRLFPQSRVVGGEKSTFGKWPWQVSQNYFFFIKKNIKNQHLSQLIFLISFHFFPFPFLRKFVFLGGNTHLKCRLITFFF